MPATEASLAGGGRIRGIARQHLIDAAAALFAERGYRATTLDDVAAVLEVKKASLYHYIGSKEDLLTEIYDRIFNEINSVVAPIAKLDLPAPERLRRMIHAHIGVVAAERAMLAVVFREESELPDAAQKVIRRRKRSYEALFEQVIEEGQKAGLLRDSPTRLVVIALLGMCNWMYQWYSPDQFDSEEVGAVFALVFERGVLADGDDRQRLWPRPADFEEAFESLRRSILALSKDADAAVTELQRAQERLQDGLATELPSAGNR